MYQRAKAVLELGEAGRLMDFSFTAEQESLREHLRELLDEVCPPEYAQALRQRRPPAARGLRSAREARLVRPDPARRNTAAPAAPRSSSRSCSKNAAAHFEELGMWVFRTLTYGGYAVMQHGTPEQKEALLPRVARGELSFCFGLTEPQAGSDAAAIDDARRAPGRWRLRRSTARKCSPRAWTSATTACW